MADSWKITDVNKETVSVSVVITNNVYDRVWNISSLDSSTLAKMRDSLRSELVEFRKSILVDETAPSVISSIVGYTEVF